MACSNMAKFSVTASVPERSLYPVVFCIGVWYRKHHHNGDVAGGAGHIGDFADLLEHLLFCFCLFNTVVTQGGNHE